MLFGDPYKFGFLIERVDEWEYPPIKNGLMFMYLNGHEYPDKLRTTALSEELPELTADSSPLMAPKDDPKLFCMDSDERFEKLAALSFPEDIDIPADTSYLVPFHEINAAGYAVFVLSAGGEVLICTGQWSEGKLLPIDELILPAPQYMKTVSGMAKHSQEILKRKEEITEKPSAPLQKAKTKIHKIK